MMKAKDIKTYEIGNHCFGEFIKVNGVDFEDIPEEDVLEFINDMLKNDINRKNILIDVFKRTLEYLQGDLVDSYCDMCDQCGNYNEYAKFERKNDVE